MELWNPTIAGVVQRWRNKNAEVETVESKNKLGEQWVIYFLTVPHQH